ncbi:hypothetical protein QA640_22735 [Bradyrhizobium sp. CB82]|uniref:hypothetical protein n=1 Tax=Bradyrhizobium sp. CB82 TaxID=3039159 RepID=UPI0024B14642|nr:hypothetical protein [Bradyrhizobium sp. CB82]WFU37312.1 hypothetical protein QA640_22735 [Bradyrhizobium sp. CB82]
MSAEPNPDRRHRQHRGPPAIRRAFSVFQITFAYISLPRPHQSLTNARTAELCAARIGHRDGDAPARRKMFPY